MDIKILYLGGTTERLKELELAESNTQLDAARIISQTKHLDYEFYEHLSIHESIKVIVEAEKDGYDAVVIGCFYDPGLQVARELVKIPVVGVCEASLSVASMLTAGKFSILVGSRKNIPQMANNARIYGYESRIASWRTLDIPILELKGEETEKAIMREAKIAVEEDLAECIVLGCTFMAGKTKNVQKILGVPVLDPALMGVKVAELRANLWKRFGISHSKIGGYKGPPSEELKPLFEKVYGIHL